MLARIHRSSQREFLCLPKSCEGSGGYIKATAHGNLLKYGDIVVGDWVELEQLSPSGEYVITSICTRKNEVFRYLAREKKKKTIGANIDQLAIIVSCSKPDFKRGLLDRYLIRSIQWQIPPLVIFNKADELVNSNQEEFNIEFERERLNQIQIPSLCLSSMPEHEEHYQSELHKLKMLLTHKTVVFLGQSGVGKSTLVSLLSGHDLKSSELAKVGKGSHTTTWAELISCANFTLMDSPGIRSFSLEDILIDEFDDLFPDLLPYFPHCQFKNCAHNQESPGCAFHPFREGSDSSNPYLISRLESYIQFKEEVEALPHWKKKKKFSKKR